MDTTLQDRIRQQIGEAPVVLFMKGTPVFPQCGFSAAVVQILSHLGVKFKGIDVLADPSVRQGIKEFSNWPTVPQLYVQGEFIGGCDIVREMFETGELQQVLEEKGVPIRASARSKCEVGERSVTHSASGLAKFGGLRCARPPDGSAQTFALWRLRSL
jgi:monothiol glutaredoxin